MVCLDVYLPKKQISQVTGFVFQVDDITIGSLDDVPSSGPVSSFFRSIRKTLDFDFEDDNEGCF